MPAGAGRSMFEMGADQRTCAVAHSRAGGDGRWRAHLRCTAAAPPGKSQSGMPVPLTAVQVEALAPDAASAAAGKQLAQPGSWKSLGQSPAAIWGECQGSAGYQTRVALSDLAAKCSCPSRKFPCKHALALLWLAVNEPALLATSAQPEWVTSWLEQRDAAQERKAARARAGADKPIDLAARTRRAEKRQDNILAGL